jgi:cytochrome c biogenesis protein CcmG/thiol:disulfide interchange protein DsbE
MITFRLRAVRVIYAALALIALAACEGRGRGPSVGAPIADYGATTLTGDSVSLASLRGDVVLLNLWATWCVPCRTETPYLQSISEEYGALGLEVVGVSQDVGDVRDDIAMFVEEYGVTYTILHDPQMRGLDLYRVFGMPGSFLIDREGILRWMQYGPILEGDPTFLRALEDVLSRAGSSRAAPS